MNIITITDLVGSFPLYIYVSDSNGNNKTYITTIYQFCYSLDIEIPSIFNGESTLIITIQDIYGNELFPTTSKELDILKYKSQRIFDVKYIENG